MIKGRGRTEGFRQTLSRPTIPPPESTHWFWNPNRAGVKSGPDWFMEQLRKFDPDLTVTWDGYQEKWLVWMKSPRINTKLCQGWMLLFPVRYSDGSYMPLDERVFARLYSASAARWDSGKHYWDAIQREQERDKERSEKSRNDDVKHSAGEYFDFMAIKNIGKGNKFTNHFS